MKKWLNVLLTLVITVICSMTMLLPAYAAELPGVSVPVTISLSGVQPDPAEDFTVILKAENVDNPMPEGAVDGTYTMTITGEGTKNFPVITYNKVGVYTYSVYQIAGSRANGVYDDTVYTLMVTVSNKADYSGLEVTAVLYQNSDNDKLYAAEFKNEYIANGRLTVTKRVYTFDDDFNAVLMPVENETYTVGLFLDEEGTIPVDENYKKEIHLVNASSGSVVYDKLPEGSYYLYEIGKDGVLIPIGESYENAEGETWSCTIVNASEEEDNGVDIIQPDFIQHEYFVNNYYYEFPGEYYFEGQISITKKVLIDGISAEVDDTFYAGIFRLAEDGTSELLKVVTLKQNGTVVTSVPLNIVDGIPVETEYKILETDANGTPVGDGFEYEVSGEGNVTLKEATEPESITIINEKTAPAVVPDPTATPVITATPAPSTPIENAEGKVDPVQTGDNTPIVMFGIILVLTFGIIIGLVAIIKKRRSHR